MDLKFPGVCAVCGRELEAGARGYWEPADRTVTCTALECAKARGLTRSVWWGSPISGRWIDQLAAEPIGGVARPIPALQPGRVVT